MSLGNLFSERLRQAMSMRGLKQVDLCEKTGIPKSALSQYLRGSFEPKQDRLWILAKALNVSEAWLMGYDTPIERSSEVRPQPDDTIVIQNDPLAGQLFAAYGKVKEEFTQEEIDDITMMMEVIAERKRKKREKEKDGN